MTRKNCNHPTSRNHRWTLKGGLVSGLFLRLRPCITTFRTAIPTTEVSQLLGRIRLKSLSVPSEEMYINKIVYGPGLKPVMISRSLPLYLRSVTSISRKRGNHTYWNVSLMHIRGLFPGSIGIRNLVGDVFRVVLRKGIVSLARISASHQSRTRVAVGTNISVTFECPGLLAKSIKKVVTPKLSKK